MSDNVVTQDRPATTRKEAIWLACKQKTCCYTSFVLPSGRDIWRIARTMDVPPSTFLVYFEVPRPTRDSFALDNSGRTFRLALSKGKTRKRKTPPPCIFLLKTRNGYHRCGLGALRPQVCHTFPLEQIGSIVCIPGETGCTCRSWSLVDADIDDEMVHVNARQDDFKEYCEVVSFWNAKVGASEEGTIFNFLDFCEYVIDAYDAIDTVHGGTDDEEIEWNQTPSEPSALQGERGVHEEPAI